WMKRLLAVLAAALTLTGCATAGSGAGEPVGRGGTTSAAAATPATGFNATDVMFLQMMVPHLEQGRQIAALARTHPTRRDVAMLAAAIESTQATEIETMSGWLRTWGQPASASADAHAAHGGGPATSPEEIAVVAGTSGADFERAFLN